MKKAIIILLFLPILIYSCNKNKNIDDLSREISLESAQITFSNSGGEINITESFIKSLSNDYYTAGEIEFIQNGDIVAKVNFGDGEENSLANLTQNGIVSPFDLQIDESYYDGKKSKYKKVIVEPLIKSNDCEYIIAGIIKYFDYNSGEWVATIDFGNRTCDEWATKTTHDDNGEAFVFSLDDWKKQ